MNRAAAQRAMRIQHPGDDVPETTRRSLASRPRPGDPAGALWPPGRAGTRGQRPGAGRCAAGGAAAAPATAMGTVSGAPQTAGTSPPLALPRVAPRAHHAVQPVRDNHAARFGSRRPPGRRVRIPGWAPAGQRSPRCPTGSTPSPHPAGEHRHRDHPMSERARPPDQRWRDGQGSPDPGGAHGIRTNATSADPDRGDGARPWPLGDAS
jgi:hypothetical protein